MDESLQNLLLKANEKYQIEGFVILGIFGSRAPGDNRLDRDLDILYKLEERFYDLYSGWNGIGRIEDIKAELGQLIGLKIDLVDRGSLRSLSERFILPETLYVA